MLVIGMISGTSADGIDAALVDIRGEKLRVEAFETVKYPKKVREAILAASNAASISVREISRLNFEVGELFARAALRLDTFTVSASPFFIAPACMLYVNLSAP